jgi:hypothetical protein
MAIVMDEGNFTGPLGPVASNPKMEIISPFWLSTTAKTFEELTYYLFEEGKSPHHHGKVDKPGCIWLSNTLNVCNLLGSVHIKQQ